MQHMQMRMKLPLKHDIRYVQHFAKMNSEHCQASEEELFVKTVNNLKPLKAVIAKRSTLVFDRVLSTHLLSLNCTYERGEGSQSRSVA